MQCKLLTCLLLLPFLLLPLLLLLVAVGASGFGTPVALAAPMLASLGHDPLLTVVCLLIMNTFATQFGEH